MNITNQESNAPIMLDLAKKIKNFCVSDFVLNAVESKFQHEDSLELPALRAHTFILRANLKAIATFLSTNPDIDAKTLSAAFDAHMHENPEGRSMKSFTLNSSEAIVKNFLTQSGYARFLEEQKISAINAVLAVVKPKNETTGLVATNFSGLGDVGWIKKSDYESINVLEEVTDVFKSFSFIGSLPELPHEQINDNNPLRRFFFKVITKVAPTVNHNQSLEILKAAYTKEFHDQFVRAQKDIMVNDFWARLAAAPAEWMLKNLKETIELTQGVAFVIETNGDARPEPQVDPISIGKINDARPSTPDPNPASPSL